MFNARHIAFLFLLTPLCAMAAETSAEGFIDKLVVGRNGNEVFVSMSQVLDTDCTPLHPNAYRYIMFLDSNVAAQEILAAMLGAFNASRRIRIQGTGVCLAPADNAGGYMMEQIRYVELKSSSNVRDGKTDPAPTTEDRK